MPRHTHPGWLRGLQVVVPVHWSPSAVTPCPLPPSSSLFLHYHLSVRCLHSCPHMLEMQPAHHLSPPPFPTPTCALSSSLSRRGSPLATMSPRSAYTAATRWGGGAGPNRRRGGRRRLHGRGGGGGMVDRGSGRQRHWTVRTMSAGYWEAVLEQGQGECSRVSRVKQGAAGSVDGRPTRAGRR